MEKEKIEETLNNYNVYEEQFSRSRVPNMLTYWWVGEKPNDNTLRKSLGANKSWKTEAAVAQHAFPSANPSMFPSEALFMAVPPPTFSHQSVLESITNPHYPFSLSVKEGVSAKNSSVFKTLTGSSQPKASTQQESSNIIYNLESLDKNVINFILTLLKTPSQVDPFFTQSKSSPNTPPQSRTPTVDVISSTSPSPYSSTFYSSSPFSSSSPFPSSSPHSLNISFSHSQLSPFFSLQLHHQVVVILGSSVSYQKTLNIFEMGDNLGQYLGTFKETNRHVIDLGNINKTHNTVDLKRKEKKVIVSKSMQGSEVVVVDNDNRHYETVKQERGKMKLTQNEQKKDMGEEKMKIKKKFDSLFRLEAKPCASLVEMIRTYGVDDNDMRVDTRGKNNFPPIVSLLYPSCISFTYLKTLYAEEKKLYDRIVNHVKLAREPNELSRSSIPRPSLSSRHSFPLSFPHTSLSSLFHSPPSCSLPCLFSIQGITNDSMKFFVVVIFFRLCVCLLGASVVEVSPFITSVFYGSNYVLLTTPPVRVIVVLMWSLSVLL
jgi:hypothetical protein